ncbi:hypothetical protein Egran_02789, partial [Elaphomyces granulatus]
MDDLK